jgi:hypothetical protein
MNIRDLASYIRSMPNLEALAEIGDAEGLLAMLNARTIPKRNDELQTVAGVLHKLGLEVGGQAIAVFKGAAQTNVVAEAFYPRLMSPRTDGSEGINFADAQVQQMIDAIFVGDYEPLAAPLKALGIWQASLSIERFGIEATLQDVEASLERYALLKLQERVSAAAREVHNAIDKGEVEDWAGVVSMMGEL